jgi:hypothetical protein
MSHFISHFPPSPVSENEASAPLSEFFLFSFCTKGALALPCFMCYVITIRLFFLSMGFLGQMSGIHRGSGYFFLFTFFSAGVSVKKK